MSQLWGPQRRVDLPFRMVRSMMARQELHSHDAVVPLLRDDSRSASPIDLHVRNRSENQKT
jgi:hypothetical protein